MLTKIGIKNYEFLQSIRTIYSGPISPDSSEVMEIRVIGLSELEAAFLSRSEDFTPWFRQRASDLDPFQSAV